MALRLRRYGITRVRPLEGGLHEWRERQYPLDRVDGAEPAPARDSTSGVGVATPMASATEGVAETSQGRRPRS